MDKEFRARELGDELHGTHQDLDDLTSKAERDDTELMDLLDDQVTECNQCGIWFAPDEASDDDKNVCKDCP